MALIWVRPSLEEEAEQQELDEISDGSQVMGYETFLLQVLSSEIGIFIGTLGKLSDTLPPPPGDGRWYINTISNETFDTMEDATNALISGDFTMNTSFRSRILE